MKAVTAMAVIRLRRVTTVLRDIIPLLIMTLHIMVLPLRKAKIWEHMLQKLVLKRDRLLIQTEILVLKEAYKDGKITIMACQADKVPIHSAMRLKERRAATLPNQVLPMIIVTGTIN